MDRLTRSLLSFFGLGFLPIAPGTWGSAGALAVALILPAGAIWPIGAAALIVLSSIATIALGNRAEAIAGKKDPGFIVTDEVAGYFVTVAALGKPEAGWLIVGFFVFRVFDILKPWPGRQLEKLPAGVGVLLDDLMAGVYGFAVMFAAQVLSGWSGAL